jgi:predicted NUDIX family phosphoesterase
MSVQEHILVLPANVVEKLFNSPVHGLNWIRLINDESKYLWMRRERVEEDSNYRQIIPYAVVEKDGKILVYRRYKDGAEKRLVSKYSFGFGGHIHKSDKNWIEGFRRELVEEIELKPEQYVFAVKGIICSNSTFVDSVHLGIIIQVNIIDPEFEPLPNLSEVSELIWSSYSGMQSITNVEWESWSKLLLENDYWRL